MNFFHVFHCYENIIFERFFLFQTAFTIYRISIFKNVFERLHDELDIILKWKLKWFKSMLKTVIPKSKTVFRTAFKVPSRMLNFGSFLLIQLRLTLACLGTCFVTKNLNGRAKFKSGQPDSGWRKSGRAARMPTPGLYFQNFHHVFFNWWDWSDWLTLFEWNPNFWNKQKFSWINN